mmetsp:Transcript_8428/g.15875  ORF Transcript_8428/g.15875 Transcript_8428/m.15875 type:complete len:235 (-) Transcript_8428:582-1286(-)
MGNRMCRVIKRGCMAQAMKVPTFIYIQKRVFPMRTGTMVTKLIRTSPRICNCQSHVVGIEYHYNGTVLQNNRGRICVTTDIKINWSVVKFPRSFNIVRERNWKCIVFHRCVVDGSGRLVSPGVTIGDKCHHRIAPMPVTTLLILARRRPIHWKTSVLCTNSHKNQKYLRPGHVVSGTLDADPIWKSKKVSFAFTICGLWAQIGKATCCFSNLPPGEFEVARTTREFVIQEVSPQ